MSSTASHELEYFPREVMEGVEQIKINQRVIRVNSSHLSALGIPHTEQQGNTQNLDMAEEVMKAMEIHSPSRGIQVCWMNYPGSYEQKSVDLVFVRIPFTLDKSTSTVLVRLQVENDMGAQLQDSIVKRLTDTSTRMETARQLLAPNEASKIDLSEMNVDHCDYIPQSVFDLAKRAYTISNPGKTRELIKDLIVTSGKPVESQSTPMRISLDEFLPNTAFFRDDPVGLEKYRANRKGK